MIPKTLQLLGGLAAACGLIIAATLPAGAQSLSIDASGGTGFNPGIFGQGLNNQAYYTQGRGAAYEKNLGLLQGTSVRGPSEGSNAMTYNWKTRIDRNQNTPAPGGGYAKGKSTLDLLRDVRDYESTPVITVNEQSIGTIDGSGNFVVTDSSIGTMTLLASDWVRYTNRIVQTYRQGDTITDSEDLRILNSLSWGGPDFSNDLLLAPGEAAVPKVTYWEIGNESEYYDTPDVYRSRYHDITTAMLAQDSNIKVGAGMAGKQGPLNGSSANYINRLLEPQFGFFGPLERVDFIAYHPYGYQVLSVNASNPANHGAISQELNNIKTNQQAERDWVNGKIAELSLLVIRPISEPGNYNGDAAVDAADYVVWRKSINTPEKYDEWVTNFGGTLGGGSGCEAPRAAVPEPATLAYGLVVVSNCLFAGRMCYRAIEKQRGRRSGR